ncbi:flavin reductase family protein [Paenibacillus woosongensis]|uniref:Flavin reductase family protein n=1 Tax=Paenibacillus woosongensis TaxID=307580 RepID=A0A7X2YXR6_9BACL|nr:flavin reductase family protein [Paenibacillus woosongensis]MUG43698.1 flavin reductase family protein [Paenibacillus woosongensis]
MISIDPSLQSERDNYKLLIGSIIPRPIAFVTTLSESGVLNAAPFSYFSIVSSSPPMLSIAVQRKNGVAKDTARNAAARGELVVHIVDESMAAAVNETAANLAPEESEIALTSLTTVASEVIAVPGIREAKVRMECVLEKLVALGGTEDAPPTTDLLIARVVRFIVEEEIYEEGRIDPVKLNPVSRLAGSSYAGLGKMFEIERPQ